MKKTLFAVAALALCGTAVAGTYDVGNYEGTTFNHDFPYAEGEDVVLNVNAPVTLANFSVYWASSLTLNFVGENILSSGGDLDFEAGQSSGFLAITGDSDAKIHWATALTSADITSVTLASGGTGDFFTPQASVSFDGLTESGSITLGNATVYYVGYYEVTTADDAEPLITGDNQIVLVTITDTKQLALVGKITPTAPEPATATLSLLALAGLCARRRRH